MKRLLADDELSKTIFNELVSKHYSILTDKQVAALNYVAVLTLSPVDLSNNDIKSMRVNSWNDGEILEINQVAAYFNYDNRTVLGLGITIEDDDIGLSPNNSNDINDWNHS